MSASSTRRWLLLLIAAHLVHSTPLQAQLVTGTVVSDTNIPLIGAFVRLFDASGEQRGAVLTGAMGRYRVMAPEEGAYSLRVEMIGHFSAESGPMTVTGATPGEWSPSLSARAITLPGLEVAVGERCTMGPGEGSVVAAIWEEAQKALTIAAWAAKEGRFHYVLENHQRELAMDGETVVSEESGRREGFFSQPFVSLPADELLDGGFVQETPDGTFAYAPDAQVLLSEDFVDGYCFRLATEGDARVGISFEPTRDRDRADIKGTMWLNRATSRLESVVFEYLRFPGAEESEELGGRVDFEQLPSGAWIVRRWNITMPIMADVQRRRLADGFDRRQTGFHEVGAEVLRALTRDGEAALVAGRASLGGVARDGVRGGPLVGAEIRLEGTDYRAVTGDDGGFHMADLPEGRYTVQFEHPRLDSLGVSPSPKAVSLATGETTWVEVGVPTEVRIGDGEPWAVRGELREGSDQRPLGGVLVSLVNDGGRIAGSSMTDEIGSYEMPLEVPGTYRLQFDVLGRTSALSEFFQAVGGNRILHSHLFDGATLELPPGAPNEAWSCIQSPAGESPTGRAWTEVRKTLANLLWVRDSRQVEYAISRYTRERAERGERPILREDRLPLQRLVTHSLEPIRPFDLHAEGFVQASRSSLAATVPDPRILASDWLSSESCLRLVPDVAGSGMFGLEIRQDVPPDRAGIRGLFILNRETGLLESFHYRYTNFPAVATVETPGGWMTFEHMPQAGVFLSEWESRLPQGAVITNMVADDRPATALGAAWIINEGGYVTQASDVWGDTLWTHTAVGPSLLHTDSLWALGSSIDPKLDADDLVDVERPPPSSDEARRQREVSRSSPSSVVVTYGDGTDGEDTGVQVIGTVRARESGDPLPDVLLRIADLPDILTDAQGRFSVTGLRQGRYPVEVEFLGREPVRDTLVLGDALAAVTITLSEAPIELDALVVEVEPRSYLLQEAGFYNRRDRSGIAGTRFTRWDIEQRLGGVRVSDVLTNVPGTRIRSVSHPAGGAVMRVNRPGNVFGFQQAPGDGCEPSVYVDGLIYADNAFPGPGEYKVQDLNFLPVDAIEGIEVYTGLTTPAQFDANSCGLVLIWTRGFR